MAKLCFGCMAQKKNSPVCEYCGFDENGNNEAHQLPVGTLLNGQYLIGRVLGQGGFGITYMAWDQHLSVPVAIKEYYPSGVVHRHSQLGLQIRCENGESPELFRAHKDRFLKEARMLAKLSDIPQIVQIRNYFSENGTAYIVMEYVKGITLKAYLQKLGRPLTEKEVLDIMEPLLRALQKVHDQHLIHRDISPDNIMLPEDGGIKLIDFGTVGYLDPSGRSKSTQTVLKPGYAPMEQYNANGRIGPWTDVYAVCASSHYLLTGKVPADVHERMELGEELTELRKHGQISRMLVDTLENGMRLRAANRIQTVEELYDRLYAASDSRKPKEKSGRSGKWALAFGAAAVLALSAMLLTPRNAVPQETEPVQIRTEPVQTVPETEDPLEGKYEAACTLLEEGRYEEAKDLFSQLEGYRDSVQKMEECTLGSLYIQAEALEEAGEIGKAAIAFGKLENFRDARHRSLALWQRIPGRKTVSFWNGGEGIMVHALRQDGTIAVDTQNSAALTQAYLDNYYTAEYRDIVSIHGPVGLRCDGTLALPKAMSQYRELEDWQDIVALSIRYCDYPGNTYVGLRSDGTVVATGYNGDGQCDVDHWRNIVAISCGQGFVLGLRSDGTVAVAGNGEYGQYRAETWTDIVAITTTTNAHVAYGLKSDGTVVTAGVNQWSDDIKLPTWKNIVAIYENAGIQADGTLLCTSMTSREMEAYGPTASLTYLNKLPVGLRTDSTLCFGDIPQEEFARARTWTDIQIPAAILTD